MTEPLLTRDQLAHLQRLADRDGLTVSNRNGTDTIARSTATALIRLGLAEDQCLLGPKHQLGITDSGRSALAANAGHVPPKLHELAAYRRGVQRAGDVRRVALRELADVLADQEARPPRDQSEPAIVAARALLDRLTAIEQQEIRRG